MVRIGKDGEIYIKITFWGTMGCGKTTAVDTLYQITKTEYSDVFYPVGELTKISLSTGATLYFDRGVFQAKKFPKQYLHIYTVAGQIQLGPLRKKVYQGTDGIIFMFDAQRHFLNANIDSLKELKKVAQNDTLIRKIPLAVMVNKQDLPDIIHKTDVEEVLRAENLLFPPKHELFPWNPPIYETIALYRAHRNVYQVFAEVVRRINIYQKLGQGSAPQSHRLSLGENVPDL